MGVTYLSSTWYIAHYIQPFELDYVTLTLVEAHLTKPKHVFNYTQFLLSQVESSCISILILDIPHHCDKRIEIPTFHLLYYHEISCGWYDIGHIHKAKKTLNFFFEKNPKSMVNGLESFFIQNCQNLLCKNGVIYGELPSFNRLSENWWNV